jgi:hypothetical protein
MRKADSVSNRAELFAVRLTCRHRAYIPLFLHSIHYSRALKPNASYGTVVRYSINCRGREATDAAQAPRGIEGFVLPLG